MKFHCSQSPYGSSASFGVVILWGNLYGVYLTVLFWSIGLIGERKKNANIPERPDDGNTAVQRSSV
jgi:hypothetical protein